MIHRIDETVPMNELPTWLQELWELDSALARRAEKHYLELKQVKNLAIPIVTRSALQLCPKCNGQGTVSKPPWTVGSR